MTACYPHDTNGYSGIDEIMRGDGLGSLLTTTEPKEYYPKITYFDVETFAWAPRENGNLRDDG
jgi:hypothetical protein